MDDRRTGYRYSAKRIARPEWESRWNRITHFLDGRSDAGGIATKLLFDSSAHNHSACGWGKPFNSIFDCYTLIQEQFDRLHSNHRGTRWRHHPFARIANLAEMYQVRTGSHGATDLTPVSMGAALHFDLSVHNFGIQEYVQHTAETDAVLPHSCIDGLMHPGEAPGIGVDIDEELATPYQ